MKTKIITAIKIILTMTIIVGIIAIYNNHENEMRREYAERNNCKWVVYSGYELCK